MAITNGDPAINCGALMPQRTSPRGFGHGDPGRELERIAGRFDPRGQDDD